MARDDKDRRGKDRERRHPVPPGGPSLLAAQPPASILPPPRHVYRWDLDKTYLKTEFDTFKQLVRSAFEGAEAKQSVPGAAALLRELRAAGAGEAHRISFISGSPTQMRKVLSEKLKLDGVQFDEFILKPNMSNLLRGRFRAIREQVGYKLPALLAGRLGVPPGVPETLFGDDAEGDAFIYSLYADILSGHARKETVIEILQRLEVYADVAERTLGLMENLAPGDGVRRIFIHLDKRSPPARFDRYGSRLVPIYNYFQAAAVLYEDRILDAHALVRVATDMVMSGAYDISALCNSYQDLVRRGRLSRQTAERLVTELGPTANPIVAALTDRVRALGEARAQPAAAQLDPVDYLAALAEDPPRRPKKPPPPKKKK